jgi:hypothetical protein
MGYAPLGRMARFGVMLTLVCVTIAAPTIVTAQGHDPKSQEAVPASTAIASPSPTPSAAVAAPAQPPAPVAAAPQVTPATGGPAGTAIATSPRAVSCPAENGPWDHRYFAIQGHVGLATPIGFVGVMLEARPVKWTGTAIGVGKGFDGTQYAVMQRLRLAIGGFALSGGLGLSGGDYNPEFAEPSYGVTRWTTWLNTEAAVEGHWDSGLELMLYLGNGRPFQNGVPDLPYLGIAIGVAPAFSANHPTPSPTPGPTPGSPSLYF